METRIELKAISFDKLNNDEYSQFLKGVVKLIEGATLEKLAIKPELFSSLTDKLNLLTEASRQTRLSQDTEKIIKLDKQRSEVLSYLISSFKLKRKSVIDKEKEAANALYKEFKNYSGTHVLPMRQKSQAIDALLKDLEKSFNGANINTLGLAKSVEMLGKYNLEYQNLVVGRAETQLANTSINAKKVRKEVKPIFMEIIKYAFAVNVINTSEESSNFIKLLNKLIIDTMNANKQRLAKFTTKTTEKATEKPVA